MHQVNASDLSGLRDSLLTALERYHSGPRAIIVQLCLAVAGLALQSPGWSNPVAMMIESFGRNSETVPVLLQFLTILPEELMNTRIPVTVGESYSNVNLQLVAG